VVGSIAFALLASVASQPDAVVEVTVEGAARIEEDVRVAEARARFDARVRAVRRAAEALPPGDLVRANADRVAPLVASDARRVVLEDEWLPAVITGSRLRVRLRARVVPRALPGATCAALARALDVTLAVDLRAATRDPREKRTAARIAQRVNQASPRACFDPLRRRMAAGVTVRGEVRLARGARFEVLYDVMAGERRLTSVVVQAASPEDAADALTSAAFRALVDEALRRRAEGVNVIVRGVRSAERMRQLLGAAIHAAEREPIRVHYVRGQAQFHFDQLPHGERFAQRLSEEPDGPRLRESSPGRLVFDVR
jgi:hypothetical protein